MIIVKYSPWPSTLPVGTEILKAHPRPSHPNKTWYTRKDGKLVSSEAEDTDGKFVLYHNEIEEVNN
jgi:hypothetical protein